MRRVRINITPERLEARERQARVHKNFIYTFLSLVCISLVGFLLFLFLSSDMPLARSDGEQGNIANSKQDFSAVARVVTPKGTGTAFLIMSNNATHALTAEHVVHDTDITTVTLQFEKTGEQCQADVILKVPDKDVALLQVREKPSKVQPLVLGDSNLLSDGDHVVLLGYPLGTWSLTAGVISQCNPESILTDAASNQGNSGGPLVHEAMGKVVGVLLGGFWRDSQKQQTAEGMHRVVPINVVKTIMSQNNKPIE